MILSQRAPPGGRTLAVYISMRRTLCASLETVIYAHGSCRCCLLKMSNSVISVISRFLGEYASSTQNKLKVIDSYLLYIMMTGALQFLYCLLVGSFPFNSFLSGFISCVGSFILAGN